MKYVADMQPTALQMNCAKQVTNPNQFKHLAMWDVLPRIKDGGDVGSATA